MKLTSRLLPLLLALAAATPGFAQSPKPAAGAATDQGWPRTVEHNGTRIVYYQPQIDGWPNQRTLNARVAFLVTPKGGKATPGIATLSGPTMVDMQNRTVFINKMQISSLTFPGASADETTKLTALMKDEFPGKSMTISLDRVMAAMAKLKKDTKGVPVQMEVPPIYASATPAILLIIPEKPVLGPIAGSGLQFIVNANWNVFFDPGSSTYYLLAGKTWLSSQALTGPWSIAVLPDSLLNLPGGEMWNGVLKAASTWNPNASTVAPRVFYSAKPAELLLFNGEPTYDQIPGTSLEWATNTDSHVFWDSGNKKFYFMVTGRWFSATNLEGPWTYAGNDLPDDFKKIPANNPSASVLSSVPGTPDAEDAVMLAQIPTTAVVNRAQAEAKAKVTYYGNPEFKPIEGTSLSYAVNTSSDVIQDGSQYYLCQNAVWFAASAPTGPWKVTTEIPSAIYQIPPSAPVYNVTYVQQYPTDNPATVQSSYTAGYTGSYIAGLALGAALVYGTGYYYPPYIGYYSGFPVYSPWYGTYGYGAAYNWGVGAYGVGGWGYGPYGAAGAAAWYNPNTGFYSHGAAAAGPYGGRAIADGYNPRTGTAYATRQGYGPYGSWGTTAATRGDQWAQAGHVTTPYGTTAGYRSSQGAGVAHSGAYGNSAVGVHDGNMYADHDGNVYKRDAGGGWQKYNNGSWNSVNHGNQFASSSGYRPPENTTRDLNNDYAARSDGYNRANNYARNDGGWGDRYNGGGGFDRGGGGDDRFGGGGFGDHFGSGSFGGGRFGGGGGFRGGGFRGGGRR